jgi:hypothetical protein
VSFVWDEVRTVAAADTRVVVLDDAAAHDVSQRVKQRFISDARANWWWESLRGESEWLHYEDAAGGLELLRARIEREPTVNLLVIDEQTEPHGVVAGTGEAILHLLEEMPIFEFAITDPEARWLILDTHHNELVLVGDVPG